MSRQSVRAIPEDQGLSALARVLNTDLMLPLLAQAAGLDSGWIQSLGGYAEMLNHKPGERCTIRYTLTRTGDSAQSVPVAAVIGKLYRSARLAERMYQRTAALRNWPFKSGLPCIPAPLMLVSDLGLVLQENVAAGDLRHLLAAGNNETPMVLAAQWLARLHTVSPLPELEVRSIERELAKVDQWCADIAPHLPAANTDVVWLRRTQDGLHRLSGAMPPYTPVMIHKDFYYANVLWDGHGVWVLDFDQLSIGDPGLDVAHFLAHLENLAYRITGQVDSFTQAAVTFLRSYEEQTGLNLEPRFPFYRAYTFLKLAATEVSRKRPWQQLAGVLTNLAYREVTGEKGGARIAGASR